MSEPTKATEEILRAARQILNNEASFCQQRWYQRGKGERTPSGTGDNPFSSRGNYDHLEKELKSRGSSVGNPNFQVCGQGAIAVAAILTGHSFDEARTALEHVEQSGRYQIVPVNDGHKAEVARPKVIEMIEARIPNFRRTEIQDAPSCGPEGCTPNEKEAA